MLLAKQKVVLVSPVQAGRGVMLLLLATRQAVLPCCSLSSRPVWKLEAGQRVPHCKAQELVSCPSSHEEPLGACKGPPRGLTAQH